MFSPGERPLTVLVGDAGFAIVPLPLINVHWPIAGPINGEPAKLVLVTGEQSCWSGPASATGCAGSKTKIITRSVVTPHSRLSISHSSTFIPTERPVTVVVGEDGSAKTALPSITDHVPTPGASGMFAAKV